MHQVAQTLTVNDQTIQGVAYTNAAGFGIINNGGCFIYVAGFIKIGMHNTGTCFNHGHFTIPAHIIDQVLATPWYQYIHVTNRVKQCLGGFALNRQECSPIYINAVRV